MGGQGMPVGHEEQALVLVLQFNPVLEHTMVVPEMKPPRGAHAREHPGVLCSYSVQANSLQKIHRKSGNQPAGQRLQRQRRTDAAPSRFQ